MHSQPDSLFVKPDDSACIVQCACGTGHFHGQIEFYIDPGTPNTDTENAWLDAAHCYVQVAMPPVTGWWYGWFGRFWRLANLHRRIKVAWAILRGQRYEHDFEMGAQTVGDLGEWFMRAKAKADAVLATKPGEKMTLQEVRAKIQETTMFWEVVHSLAGHYPAWDVARTLQDLLEGKPILAFGRTLDEFIAERITKPITKEEIQAPWSLAQSPPYWNGFEWIPAQEEESKL